MLFKILHNTASSIQSKCAASGQHNGMDDLCSCEWVKQFTFTGSRSAAADIQPGWSTALSQQEDRPLPFQSAEENSVWQAVMELEESLRVPLYLFYFPGLTTQEIARALSIRPGAVRMRLSRGRERLRQTLKGDYFDE